MGIGHWGRAVARSPALHSAACGAQGDVRASWASKLPCRAALLLPVALGAD